ncbi:hypothetical protein ACIBEF_32325 [Micromonospora sp. NPDC050795]|uniref:hypothetical protein n=1 Tax=Micromonospora sp. NPDC050795 TaxID=3364282 RepID=UPI003796C7E5
MRHGISLTEYGGINLFDRPHAYYTPAGLSAAMAQYYQPGHENIHRHPGRTPSRHETVRMGGRDFPIGAILEDMERIGMRPGDLTPELRASFQAHWLPLREGEGGRHYIDDRARQNQFSDPAYQEFTRITKPGTILGDIKNGWEFAVTPKPDKSLEVAIAAFNVEKKCTIDTSAWAVGYDTIAKNMPTPEVSTSSPQGTLAERAQSLLKASIINTLTRQTTMYTGTSEGVRRIFDTHRGVAGAEYARNVTQFENARHEVLREDRERRLSPSVSRRTAAASHLTSITTDRGASDRAARREPRGYDRPGSPLPADRQRSSRSASPGR